MNTTVPFTYYEVTLSCDAIRLKRDKGRDLCACKYKYLARSLFEPFIIQITSADGNKAIEEEKE